MKLTRRIKPRVKKLIESMTPRETKIKKQLVKSLREDGFKTFGDYLDKFDLNLLTSEQAGQPFVAAISYTAPPIVFVNPEMSLRSVSMVLRHEIAHQVFKHRDHTIAKLKQYNKKDDQEGRFLGNVVGDYHISNTIYDETDKQIAKNIMLKNPDGSWADPIPGLVTSLDYPDNPEYQDMDFDELFDVFVKDYYDDPEEDEKNTPNPPEVEIPPELMKKIMSPDYLAGWNAIIDAFNDGKLTREDILSWAEEIKSEMAEQSDN